MKETIKVGITGDLHGELSLGTFYRAKRLQYTHLIVCGDFGYIFGGTSREQERLDEINAIGLKIFFIDGNHENFNLLSKYQITHWNGGRVQYIRENIVHLMRGEIYNFFGLKVFTLGGANSTDKEYRIKDYSWWEQELPNKEEREYALNNLKNNFNNVDIIITHTCFTSALLSLGAEYRADDFTDFLEGINNSIHYEKWYAGHMHLDSVPIPKVHFLYKIIDTLEIKL